MDNGTLELKVYWRIFLRWWWLLALGAAVGGGAAYYASTIAVPVYKSRVTIAVEGTQGGRLPTASDFANSASLAQNYADLVKTGPVLEEISNRLPVRYSPGRVGTSLKVSTRRNTIRIDATNQNPQLAAIIANTAADAFMEALLDRQITQLMQFQQVLSEYGIERNTEQIAAQVNALRLLSVVEPALPPRSPLPEPTGRNVVLAAAVGLLLSGLAVTVIEYLDDRIRTLGQLRGIQKLSALGTIPPHRRRKDKGIVAIDWDERTSPVMEAYSLLQTNLEFASAGERGIKSLLVTSSLPGEGKSTIASNLAVSMARSGKRVVLVDCDFESSRLAQSFGLNGHIGLLHMLSGEIGVAGGVKQSSFDRLTLVPTGAQSSGSEYLLRSPKFAETIDALSQHADVVILDGPPILSVADSLVLASMVDGVLIVVDSRRTARETVVQSLERLEHVKPAPLFFGGVLNRAKSQTYVRRYRPVRSEASPTAPERSRMHFLRSGRVLSGLGVFSIAAALTIGFFIFGSLG